MSLSDVIGTTSTDISATTSPPSPKFNYHNLFSKNKSTGQDNIIIGIVIIVGVQIGLLFLVAIITLIRGRGSSEPDSTSDLESQTKEEPEETKSKDNSHHLQVPSSHHMNVAA